MANSTPTCKQDASLGHAEWASERASGGVLYGRKRKERGARKYAATTKKQKKNALTFTRTPLRRERKELEVGQCLRTPENRGGRREIWERERVSGGLRPANNSLDWNVQQQICKEEGGERIVKQISPEMFYYKVRTRENNKLCVCKSVTTSQGTVSSCVTKKQVWHRNVQASKALCAKACFDISQSLFIDTILTVSSVNRCHGSLWNKKKIKCMFFFLCMFLRLLQYSSLESLSPLWNCVIELKRQECQMGRQTHCRRRVLGTSFSACVGVSSADWHAAVSSAHLLFCTCFFVVCCSCLGSDGPLGSSCFFCAGLRQKPHVSSSRSEHQRKPSKSCGGSGIKSGIKERNVLIRRPFFSYLFINIQRVSCAVLSTPYPRS